MGTKMQDLKELQTLIDKAAEKFKSEAELARAIGATPQNLNGWKKGTRPCPPEDVALMAAVAGMDATTWLARAVVQKHEGTAKGDQLMRVLGKALLATSGVLVSSGASAAAIFGSTASTSVWGWIAACSTMYRNVKFHSARPT